MLKSTEIRFNIPIATPEHIGKELGFSDETIKTYRKDVNMGSHFKRAKPHRPSVDSSHVTACKTDNNIFSS